MTSPSPAADGGSIAPVGVSDPPQAPASATRVRSRHPLLRYIAVRAVVSALLVLGVTLVTFVLTALVPADPAAAALGERSASDPAAVAAYRAEWGLDQPLPTQYGMYLSRLAHGDLGRLRTSPSGAGRSGPGSERRIRPACARAAVTLHTGDRERGRSPDSALSTSRDPCRWRSARCPTQDARQAPPALRA